MSLAQGAQQLERELNQDDALWRAFLKAPTEVLRSNGVRLSAQAAASLERDVARVQSPRPDLAGWAISRLREDFLDTFDIVSNGG